MNIYVGKMSYDVDESDLRQAFEQYGEVGSVNVIMDRDTGRSKGFGFVEMPQDKQARDAIEQMNGASLKGRSIVVNEAKPRESRPKRNNFRRRSW